VKTWDLFFGLLWQLCSRPRDAPAVRNFDQGGSFEPEPGSVSFQVGLARRQSLVKAVFWIVWKYRSGSVPLVKPPQSTQPLRPVTGIWLWPIASGFLESFWLSPPECDDNGGVGDSDVDEIPDSPVGPRICRRIAPGFPQASRNPSYPFAKSSRCSECRFAPSPFFAAASSWSSRWAWFLLRSRPAPRDCHGTASGNCVR